MAVGCHDRIGGRLEPRTGAKPAGRALPGAPVEARGILSSLPSIGLAALGGGAVASAFLSFRLWPVAWLAFVPILVAFFGARGARESLRLGMVAGLATNLPAFYWLVGTIHTFGGFPFVLAACFYFALSLFTSLAFAVLAVAVRRTGPGPLALAAPCVWIVLERFYPHLFPWRLANSQLEVPVLMQVGEWTGPFGLSFVMVWFASVLATAVREGIGTVRVSAAGVAVAVVGLLLLGDIRMPAVDRMIEEAPAARVGIVQGNLTIEEKGDVRYFQTNVRTYGALTRAIADRVDVVIWPETVITEPLSRSLRGVPPSAMQVLGTEGPLLTGAMTWEGDPRDPRYFNSVLLIGEEGRILGRSDKQILMPFGEYMPLASVFPMLRELSPQTGDFQAGDRVELLDVPGVGVFAPLNCYEDLIASIARRAVADGAAVLFAVANDGWFGDTAGPWQHEALALWRAIENRRFLLRVTNTGVTDVIDPAGRVVRRLPVFEPASMVESVALLDGRTFYSRYGDVFAWTVTVAALGLVAFGRGGRRRLTR